MTKYRISDLLDEFESKEAYIRSDAIKKIIKGKINDERIIHALNNVVLNDSSMALRNFARSALDVFGVERSPVEESPAINSKSFDQNTDNPSPATDAISPVVAPFWINRKKKLWSILVMIVAVLIFTLPYSIFSIFFHPIVKFPMALVGMLNNKADYETIYWNDSSIAISLFVWIFYIGMATAIVRSIKWILVIGLYIILMLLLILNVAGCQIMGPTIISGIE